MFDSVYNGFLAVTDVLFGWMLFLPRDLAILIVSVATAVIFTAVRRFFTNQDFLKRCKEDKDRLKELMREARKKRDKEALARFRLTKNQIAMKSLRYEAKFLALSLIPLCLIGGWAFVRIAYWPPRPDKPVTVKAYFAKPAIDHPGYVRLIPHPGVDADSPWYQ